MSPDRGYSMSSMHVSRCELKVKRVRVHDRASPSSDSRLDVHAALLLEWSLGVAAF